MGHGRGIREIATFDCAGSGQVVVENGMAYLGHMRAPNGTTIVDVRDPKHPKELARVAMPPGTHSHKVRVTGDIMIVNHELNGADKSPVPPEFRSGFGVYDISNKTTPRLLTRWETTGQGCHRFDLDQRYAYLSATMDGYVGTIVLIMDITDPSRLKEAGRWWMPGQWTAGGETPTWERNAHRCHHPIRQGNRLYTSYWLGGFVILDIDDISKPKFISGLDWSPPYHCPTHTALPLPFAINGRRYMIAADEDVVRQPDEVPAFMWMVDITDERHPVTVGSFQVDGIEGRPHPTMTACHQPSEKLMGTEVPFAWFSHGLRMIDIANPHAPREVAWYMPDVPAGCERLSSNDVTLDDRGLIYMTDRQRGMVIMERV